jgi:hypothetical protein
MKKAISLAGAAIALGAGISPAAAQSALGLSNNDSVYIDGNTFKIVPGKAKGDTSALIQNLDARALGAGAIIFRADGKLYIAEAAAPSRSSSDQPARRPQYMGDDPQYMRDPSQTARRPQYMGDDPQYMRDPSQTARRPQYMGDDPQYMRDLSQTARRPQYMGDDPQYMRDPSQTARRPQYMGDDPQYMRDPSQTARRPQYMGDDPQYMRDPSQTARRPQYMGDDPQYMRDAQDKLWKAFNDGWTPSVTK